MSSLISCTYNSNKVIYTECICEYMQGRGRLGWIFCEGCHFSPKIFSLHFFVLLSFHFCQHVPFFPCYSDMMMVKFQEQVMEIALLQVPLNWGGTVFRSICYVRFTRYTFKMCRKFFFHTSYHVSNNAVKFPSSFSLSSSITEKLIFPVSFRPLYIQFRLQNREILIYALAGHVLHTDWILNNFHTLTW